MFLTRSQELIANASTNMQYGDQLVESTKTTCNNVTKHMQQYTQQPTGACAKQTQKSFRRVHGSGHRPEDLLSGGSVLAGRPGVKESIRPSWWTCSFWGPGDCL